MSRWIWFAAVVAVCVVLGAAEDSVGSVVGGGPASSDAGFVVISDDPPPSAGGFGVVQDEDPRSVPEPGALALMGIGLAAAWFGRRVALHRP